LGDGVKLVLSANTSLLRQPSIPAPMQAKNMASRAYVLDLIRGRVDIDIDTSWPLYYSVVIRAPRRVATYLKGGSGRIIASEQGVVAAALTGTDITAGIADKWRPIHVGSAIVVTHEHPGGEARAVLTQPKLTADNSLILSLKPKPVVLSWTNVSNAQGYRLILTDESAGEQKTSQTFELKQPSLELPALKPGRYTAVVSALDTWQLDSPLSNLVSMRVVGVELPEGTYLQAGIPQLGEFQSVRLTHTDGLEIAYGSGNVFGTVPESVRMSSGRPLLARLREVGSTNEVELRLEPRAVTGNIVFFPTRAQWPGKPVGVSVSISGPGGAPLSSAIDVNLSASINSESVIVDWQRAGNTWTALIRKPPMTGPWVLRVTATDQVGQILARDFIEIASSTKTLKPSELDARNASR
jgi:hypothetical protein